LKPVVFTGFIVYHSQPYFQLQILLNKLFIKKSVDKKAVRVYDNSNLIHLAKALIRNSRLQMDLQRGSGWWKEP